MEHGSDISVCNNEGDDALQHGPVFGRADILEHLVGELKTTPQRRADAYSLIGATFVIPTAAYMQEDAEQALAFWKKSAKTPMQNPTREPAEDISPGPNSVDNNAVKARDTESLAVTAGNVDALRMQSSYSP